MKQLSLTFVLLFLAISSLTSQVLVADIYLSKKSGLVPTTLSFSGVSSISTGAQITTYEWDFGDGSTDFATSGSHTFTSDGTYTIQLIVTTSDGQKDTSTTQFVATTTGDWRSIGLNPDKRLEHGWVESGDYFYLIGGLNTGNTGYTKNAVLQYDPLLSTWTEKGVTPEWFHHFQPVEKDGLIYVINAWTSQNPFNQSTDSIYIYDPLTDEWTTSRAIPTNRRRGSSASVLYDGKIYVACGNEGGHGSHGDVKSMLDVYDPLTGRWDSLANAPIARDHIYGVVYNDQFHLVGGRQTNDAFYKTSPILQHDYFDFSTGVWSTYPQQILTGRSGAPVAVLDDKLFFIGGETNQSDAHIETEVFDGTTNTWMPVADLDTGVHATTAIVNNNAIWLAGGSDLKAISNNTTTTKVFLFDSTASVPLPILTPLSASSLTNKDISSFSGNLSGDTTWTKLPFFSMNGNQGIIIEKMLSTGAAGEFFNSADLTFPIVIGPEDTVEIEVGYFSAGFSNPTGSVSFITKYGDTITYSLSGIRPVADFSSTLNGSYSSYQLDGSTSIDLDGSILSYYWDFGDGNTSTQIAPVHTYGADGDYQIKLTVTDDQGLKDSSVQLVSISNAFPVQFTDLSSYHVGNRNVRVVWQVAQEEGVQAYEVELKRLGEDRFSPKSTQAATAGVGGNQTYEAKLFSLPYGEYLARIKALDFNGSIQYSDQIDFTLSPGGYSLYLTHNPLESKSVVHMESDHEQFIELSLFNIEGQYIQNLHRGIIQRGNSSVEFDWANLPNGIYFLKDNQGKVTEIQILR